MPRATALDTYGMVAERGAAYRAGTATPFKAKDGSGIPARVVAIHR